jgi:PhnB protein
VRRTSSRSRAVASTSQASANVPTSIASWLCVRRSAQAVEFYKRAFGAVELFRLENDGSIVARLSIDGAEFWLSDESPEHHNHSPESLGGITVRIILTVADPDRVFARAIAAGAKEVYPVTEERGWRLGRLVDPFGHHWEIGRTLASIPDGSDETDALCSGRTSIGNEGVTPRPPCRRGWGSEPSQS